MQVKGTDILYAVDLANIVRRLSGESMVRDLLPGYTDDPENCVLAATFNCNCRVEGKNPNGRLIKNFNGTTEDSPWFVWFDEIKYAEALARELKSIVYTAHSSYDNDLYGVHLPEDIGNIASQFDDGELSPKYYEDQRQCNNDRELYV